MSTQVRTGGGGRNKKSNAAAVSSGGGGGNHVDQSTTHHHANVSAANKKTQDATTKTEKLPKKATEEQLRIASITNSNTHDDPQMREKVVLLQEMTKRTEEEVCLALNECDYDLDKAANFLLESLPVGAFEKSQKKKKKDKSAAAANAVAAANDGGNNSGAPDGDWIDSNANADRREKSRNRNSNNNRNGRVATDSRGWRGRENRDGERNVRETRGGGGGGYGGDRGADDRGNNDNYRRRDGDRSGGGGGGRNGPRSGGGGGGGSYAGRVGRGGRTGGRGPGGRGDRGGYGSRSNAQDDHQEVDLWDNTIAQNAERQQQSSTDDAWGDWNNEEYEGSLKDSKVFTASSIQTTTATPTADGGNLDVSTSSARNSVSEDVPKEVVNSASLTVVNTSILQYSAAVSNPPPQLQQQQQSQQLAANVGNAAPSSAVPSTLTRQQQASQDLSSSSSNIKTSATLSAEQSQYFNSLSAQATGTTANKVQQPAQPPVTNFAQAAASANYSQSPPVQFPASYANMFSSSAAASVAIDQSAQTQLRRPRAKLPPPSKIPSSAVEMPGDHSLGNVGGFLDVQFGALDAFNADDSIDSLTDKFNTSVGIDAQQQQKQAPQEQTQSSELASNYHRPTPPGLDTAILQNDSLGSTAASAAYGQRQLSTQQSQQQQPQNICGVGLEQLVKNEPYSQTSVSSAGGYQNTYQSNKQSSTNSYQQQTPQQVYNTSSYSSNVQSSSSSGSYPAYNTFQPYQQQQQQQQAGGVSLQSSGNVGGGVSSQQNIPVGAGGSGTSGSGSNSQQQQQQLGQSNSSVSVPVGGVSGVTAISVAATITGAAGNANGNVITNNASNVSGVQANSNNAPQASNVSASITSAGGVGGGISSNSTTSSAAQTASGAGSSTVFGGGLSGKVNAGTNSTAAAISSGTSINTSVSSSAISGGSSSSGSNAVGAAPGAAGIVPQVPVVSQYIQPGMPYYQQPTIYSYEEMQILQQRLHPTYYDMNFQQQSLNSARDNIQFSALGDARFARADNNSSPVGNVSNTLSQPANSSTPMLNFPPYYFYGGMPGSFPYSGPIYPQQIQTANAPSGNQFPKPSYNPGYGSSNYDALSQQTQDYSKGAYSSNVNPQTKTQNVANQQPTPSGNDISSSMYGKGHVALNKVNSYDKQSFHAGTPPPFNLPNTQAAGGTSGQPYNMYLPMPTGGHHNMIHTQIHQMDGRIHMASSRRDSNSTGQRQQASTQSKAGAKANYSQSYWAGQN